MTFVRRKNNTHKIQCGQKVRFECSFSLLAIKSLLIVSKFILIFFFLFFFFVKLLNCGLLFKRNMRMLLGLSMKRQTLSEKVGEINSISMYIVYVHMRMQLACDIPFETLWQIAYVLSIDKWNNT